MKVMLISLGCDKNRVDSEKMLGTLVSEGFTVTEDENEAEVVIINTCCFIGDAKKESIETIFEMAQLKETGSLKVLLASGCLAVRYKDEILEEIPELDGVVSISAEHTIADAVNEALKGSLVRHIADNSDDPGWKKDCRLSDGRAFSYLKIAEGCDKNCTYCVIPSVRGHYRSYPLEDLIEEARSLVDNGTQELILVAQETTLYGLDLYGKKSLHVLLEELCKINGIRWIRILYAYPEEIYDELIEVMAGEEKICHYLDMPIQHSSDRILKRMNRRTNRASILSMVNKLRKAMPDVVLRTTLLTGFPGETEEDVEDLLSFIKEAAFDHLGVFTYSREEDTPAAAMEDQVPEEEKELRRNLLMEKQQQISSKCGKKHIGQTIEVMTEGYLPDDDIYIGRSYGDAPDVDGYVFFESDHERMTGDFVKVRIEAASEYDLQGVEIHEYTE